MISLLRSIISSARSRNSRAFFCAYSLPSSALDARYSRVSSPDFGANRMPSKVPTPSPTRKKLTLEPTLLSLTAHLHYEANIAVGRWQLLRVARFMEVGFEAIACCAKGNGVGNFRFEISDRRNGKNKNKTPAAKPGGW